MSHSAKSKVPRPIAFLFENSLFLVAGAVAALVWANLDADSYHKFVHFDLGQQVLGIAPPHGSDAHGADGHGSDGHGADGHGADGHGADGHGADGHGSHDDSGHAAATHAPEGGSDAGGHADSSGQAGADQAHAGAVDPGHDGAETGHADTGHADTGHADTGHADTGHADTAHAVSGQAEAEHGQEGSGAHAEHAEAAPPGLLAQIYYAFAGSHGLTVHFLINDLLMALFFAIAGKEVWESLLPNGALSNPRKAATPLMATLGGILGPAGIYVAGAALLGELGVLGRGWAIPCATDIAFSYLVARLVFGAGHPAIAFLLLLAIADDAAGLVILAVFYPQQPLQPVWFLMTLAAMGMAYGFHKLRLHSFWWYLLIPGVLSWLSFKLAGVHAALGLVPIIPLLPHAHTDLGLFARSEWSRDDTLNEFEHWWKNPVELILGLFGLANAGVVLSSMGSGTWLVLGGLLIGKPLGISLMTFISEKGLGLEVPAGMKYRHILSLGVIAAIGFTVALFVSTAAFPQPGPIQDSVKMGALASFAAGPLAIVVARMLGIRPLKLTQQHGSDQKDAAGEPLRTPAPANE